MKMNFCIVFNKLDTKIFKVIFGFTHQTNSWIQPSSVTSPQLYSTFILSSPHHRPLQVLWESELDLLPDFWLFPEWNCSWWTSASLPSDFSLHGFVKWRLLTFTADVVACASSLLFREKSQRQSGRKHLLLVGSEGIKLPVQTVASAGSDFIRNVKDTECDPTNCPTERLIILFNVQIY